MNKTELKNNAISAVSDAYSYESVNSNYQVLTVVITGIIYAILYLAEVIRDKKSG